MTGSVTGCDGLGVRPTRPRCVGGSLRFWKWTEGSPATSAKGPAAAGDELLKFINSLTSTAMDDFGNLRALNSHEWTQKKKTYLQLAEKHLQTCEYKTVNLYKAQKQL